jgi:nicotinate phosphoribosyltransferase
MNEIEMSVLRTDLYELTMAYGYWKTGRAEREAVFHLSFRTPPFGGGYTIAAGLTQAADYLAQLRFTADDLAYLATLPGGGGDPLFEPAFLDYLASFRFRCDVEMVEEGTVVFAQEPLLRVTGPVLQAQLVETALLNTINFQTLIATKAARVVQAADGDAVLEFGLRRAQGSDGGLSASRAAYLGGVHATSNVLAGKTFGMPLGGTQAHSWVMLFEDELDSFLAYARVMPHNVVLLVDTYDTLEGVRNAIRAGERMREWGGDLGAIRLDSGDLAWLSREARAMLDEAGFTGTKIVASGDLDEFLIEDLKTKQEAAISVWGVGTKLVTAYDQPALGGVYKLAAVRNEAGEWEERIKLSNQAAKTSMPGILQVRRFSKGGRFVGDMIYDTRHGIREPVIVDPADPTRRKRLTDGLTSEDLLVPVFRGGERVRAAVPLEESRARVQQQLSQLDPTHKRLLNPHLYPAGLEIGLHERRTEMMLRARGSD